MPACITGSAACGHGGGEKHSSKFLMLETVAPDPHHFGDDGGCLRFYGGEVLLSVIPAKAAISLMLAQAGNKDSRLRGNDELVGEQYLSVYL